VDALKAAMAVRHRKRGEKALERALIINVDDATPPDASTRRHGFSNDDVILEAEEPVTPGPLQANFSESAKAQRLVSDL